MIVLDTSLLSLVYRRTTSNRTPPPEVAAFASMLRDDVPMAIPSIVVQELLSGVKTPAAFARLDEILGGFPLLLPTREIHVRAARVHGQCRSRGIAAATVDCLIAAHAIAIGGPLFTVDADFSAIAKCSELDLFAA